MPEAKEIARLSGIPLEPRDSSMCLGCHATAADTEEWERDPTFQIEDGVQCERCHGPGSEYMAEEVMRDREAAVKAGTRGVDPHVQTQGSREQIGAIGKRCGQSCVPVC